jgi:outer membrane protein assembly factor BamB
MDDQTINPIEYYTPYDYSAKWRIMFLKSAFVYDVEPFFHSPPVFGGAWAGGTPGWYWPDQGFRVTSSQAYPRDGYAPGYVRTDATPLDIKGKSFDPLQGQTHRANLYRNGLFQTDGLLSLNGLKWKFKTGGPVRSSPVVTDGFVYIGSGDGRVYALDAETGKERWSFKTEGPVLSSACVAGGIVYIGSDDGNLYALDAQSGAKVWDVMVGAGDGRTGVIQSTPAVLYGIVFIGGNAPDEGFETAHGRTRKSWGYDAKTGERVWVQKHGYSPQGLTSMAASDGRLVCPSMLGLQIYDLQTGMITGGGSLYSSGHIRHATPSINGDRIFIPNSLEACVYEYTLDGQKQWFGWCYADPKTRSLKRAGREMFGSLTMVNETIYAPVNNGKLYTFATQAAGSAWDRPVKGWTLDVGAPLKSSLSEAGGLLYFGADDGKIRAIKAVPVDASAPETEWSFQTGGPVISTPWPGDNALYAGSDDGYVYCLH